MIYPQDHDRKPHLIGKQGIPEFMMES
jgi:hypothetical protein